uniref:PUM-HD domain-containing protein n=1 Tax=Globodera pallida TaxID=36090 RepID=A0A183CDV2_GLOPA
MPVMLGRLLVISAQCAKFELPIPPQLDAQQPLQQQQQSTVTGGVDLGFICESASRLLFLSVHWVKGIRALADQHTLMESTMKGKWCDLFVLGLVQCAHELNLPHMLRTVNAHLCARCRYGQLKWERYEELCRQIALLHLFAQKTRQLKLSGMEFAYLKAIAFTSADLPPRAQHTQLEWHVIEHGLPEDRARIVRSLHEKVTSLSLHEYGNWAIRHVLEHCTEQQKRPVLEQLLDNVPTLVTDKYGNHVIRHVLEHGLPEDRARIVRSLRENVTSLSLHEYGCRVIQCLLEHCTEQQKRPVLEQLHANVPSLVTDKYGNFVIQHMVEHGRPEDRERIVRSLQGDILKNIHPKAICNIIEKCLIFGTTEQKNALIDQVCADDGTGKPPLVRGSGFAGLEFANDVVLKMVDGADSAHRDKMMFAIEEHIPALLRLKTQELEQQNRLSKGAGGTVADKRKKRNNG